MKQKNKTLWEEKGNVRVWDISNKVVLNDDQISIMIINRVAKLNGDGNCGFCKDHRDQDQTVGRKTKNGVEIIVLAKRIQYRHVPPY